MLNSKLLSAMLSPLVLLPLLPVIMADTPGARALGRMRYTQTFEESFGPEVGSWTTGSLVLPKFSGPAHATLVETRIETRGHSAGKVHFENLDNVACTFRYAVEANVQMYPKGKYAPVSPFTVLLSLAGGPITLAPGERGSDYSESAPVHSPPQVFTGREELNFFLATPESSSLVMAHTGNTTSSHTGCGSLMFLSEVGSSLSVAVTYVYEFQQNLTPLCYFDVRPISTCQDGVSVFELNGGRSRDPEKQPLSFHWRASAPNAVFSARNHATTLLTIDTSSGPCHGREIHVMLTVSDGESSAARKDTLILR